jgi:hypothetical protein
MSYRQIEANRRNALLSTGSKTETGKKASRRNAVRQEQSASQADLALTSDLAARFLRLDSSVVERLTRYETALWHQVYQLIFVLDYPRRRNLDPKWLAGHCRSAAVFVRCDVSKELSASTIYPVFLY